MNIVIAIGHCDNGSVDSGAVGLLNESNCNREVGNFAKQYLEEAGHKVTLARIDKANSVNESLSYRVNLANSISNVDLYAEIHFNSGGGNGTEVFCVAKGGKAERYANQVLCKLVALGYKNRGVKTANFYVLRKTVAPAILIECCFVDSNEDANRYNAEALGKAIAEGITNSSINTPTPIKNEPKEAGGDYMSKTYKNGRTVETVYADSNMLIKIGSLDPYEQCEAIADVNGKIVVLYNTSTGKKAGFVKYRGEL